jgi:DNA polymerase-3 subunit delta'
MLFKDVIGQNIIKKRLIQTVKEGRVSHAQLLAGPEGSGNLALAIAFAQYICCTDRQDGESCGVCPGCNKYQKLIHPDLHFVFPVNTVKNIEKPVSDHFIEKWREVIPENPYINLNNWYDIIGIENKQGLISKFESEAIIRKLSMKSFESDYKIMIIWHPEKMNQHASNKLLKIIEEPPDKTLFFLVTDATDQIIPTILSRAQIIKIPKIADDDLTMALKEKSGLDDKQARDIAKLVNGNYLEALNAIHPGEEYSDNLKRFIQFMRLCYSRNIQEINGWIEDIITLGRERQKNFLVYSLRMIRNNFLLSLKQNEIVHLTEKEDDFSKKFHHFINDSNIENITREINKAYNDIERNAYSRIVFLDLSLKLIKLIKGQN